MRVLSASIHQGSGSNATDPASDLDPRQEPVPLHPGIANENAGSLRDQKADLLRSQTTASNSHLGSIVGTQRRSNAHRLQVVGTKHLSERGIRVQVSRIGQPLLSPVQPLLSPWDVPSWVHFLFHSFIRQYNRDNTSDKPLTGVRPNNIRLLRKSLPQARLISCEAKRVLHVRRSLQHKRRRRPCRRKCSPISCST